MAMMLWKGSGDSSADPEREALRNAKIVHMVFGGEEEQLSSKAGGCLGEAREIVSFGAKEKQPRKDGCLPAQNEVRLQRPRHANPMAPMVIWGKKPRRQHQPCIRDLYKFPTSHPCRARRPARSMLPMLYQGHFIVPKAAVSGYRDIDTMNVLLVKLYNCITKVLERKQMSAVIWKVTNSNGGAEENIRDLRKACFKIRRDVMSLGGIPLCEPAAYWRWKYNLAPF